MVCVALFALSPACAAAEDVHRGVFTFVSASHCASSGRVPADICGFGEANAAAEYEEKAPRFPDRRMCEQSYGVGACSVGFRGVSGWAGKKPSIFFSPRQQGFRLTVISEHQALVAPLCAGLSFGSRSALRRDASVKPRAPREQMSAQPRGAAPAAAAFGVATPSGVKGELPPPPPVDPNFNCAAYLEDGAKGSASTACAPAPARR